MGFKGTYSGNKKEAFFLIHLGFLILSVLLPSALVHFRLASLKTAFLTGPVCFAAVEAVRAFIVYALPHVLDSAGGAVAARNEKRAALAAAAKAAAAQEANDRAVATERKRVENAEHATASAFLDSCAAAALLMGRRERTPKEIWDRYAALLRESFDLFVMWTFAALALAMNSPKCAERFSRSKDRTTFVLGMLLSAARRGPAGAADVVKPASAPRPDESEFDRYRRVGAFPWFRDILRRAAPDEMFLEYADRFVPASDAPAEWFPRWAYLPEDERAKDLPNSVAFPFHAYLFLLLHGLVTADTFADPDERRMLTAMLTRPSPAFAEKEEKTRESDEDGEEEGTAPKRREERYRWRRRTEGWCFLHEWVSALNAPLAESFPWLRRTTASLLWNFNARDGGRKLYRDWVSPVTQESAMHMLLSDGHNMPSARAAMLEDTEAAPPSVVDVWREIADTRSWAEPCAYALLEFVYKNRDRLESCATTGNRPFDLRENDAAKDLTVPIEILMETCRPVDPDEEPFHPSSMSDDGEIPDYDEVYLRPFICDAVRISLWYLDGWLRWLTAHSERYDSPSERRQETNAIRTDIDYIMKAILDIAPDELFLREYFAKMAGTFRAAFLAMDDRAPDAAMEKMGSILKTSLQKLWSGSEYARVRPDVERVRGILAAAIQQK